MARSAATCRRWLEQHGGKWRVTVAVPADLRHVLGTRLKQSLKTDSLAVANALKHRVVTELKERIEAARDAAAGKSRAVIREAAEIRATFRDAQDPEEVTDLVNAILNREVELRGAPVREIVDPETGRAIEIYDPKQAQLAADYRAVATAKATPLALHRQAYLEKITVSARTRADDERAIKYLGEWCAGNRIPATVEAITPKIATRFLDDLPKIAGFLEPATVKKYRNRLSVYWDFMVARHDVATNPWAATKIKVPKPRDDEAERPFTDDEVRRLLTGGAPQKMQDLMMIGALTGARLEVIVDLKVRDCVDGAIHFKAAKRESTGRDVPIHPALAETIERRCRGKAPNDDLFPEWPKPKKEGSQRERSFKASNQFTDYRRKCGVEEKLPGKRRSLVNFHSFRRWFITTAERAGNPGDLVSAIVGHTRGSITLDRYSAGPAWKQAKRAVPKVKLPPLDGRPIKEARPLARNTRG